MTADVIAMRREIADIEARRGDVIRRQPQTVSEQLAQVERQQQLGSLIAAVGEGRLSITDDQDLPLIVGVLLACCPQVRTSPVTVAKSVEEAGDAWGAQEGDALFGDSAFIVAQLAAGTAYTATHSYMLDGCQMLADWLVAAVVAR